jgi:nucleoside-diphosphate-sugar epimerase
VAEPHVRLPAWLARAAGTVVDGAWAAARRQTDPPITRFLAEQLTTAHWFDQRRTREQLHWAPAVSLDEGFDRLATWYAGSL